MITCEICLDEVRPQDMYDRIGCKRCAATELGPATIADTTITIF